MYQRSQFSFSHRISYRVVLFFLSQFLLWASIEMGGTGLLTDLGIFRFPSVWATVLFYTC